MKHEYKFFGPRTFTRQVYDIIQQEKSGAFCEFTAESLRARHGNTRTVRAWQVAITRLANLYYLNWRLIHPEKPAKPYRVYYRSHR